MLGTVIMEKLALNRASKLDKSGILSDEAAEKLHAIAAKEKFIRMSRQKNAKKLAKMSLHEKINSKGMAASTGNIPKKIDLKKYKGMETSYATKPSDALGQYRRLKFNGKRNAETISVANKTLKDLGGEFEGVKRSKKVSWDNGETTHSRLRPRVYVRLPKKLSEKNFSYTANGRDQGPFFKRITAKVERGKVAGHEIDAETKAATRMYKYVNKMGIKPGTSEHSWAMKNLRRDFKVGTHNDVGVLLDEAKWLDRQGNRFVNNINNNDRRQERLSPDDRTTQQDFIDRYLSKRKNIHKTSIRDLAEEGRLHNFSNDLVDFGVSKNYAKNKLFMPQANKKRGGYKYHDYRYDD